MRKRALTFLVILFVVASAIPVLAQGKTTNDPNVSGAPVPRAQDETDSRLLRKTTYDSGYKRLHTVIEDLSRTSGMDIKSGKNKMDWRVRDIPVVVCVEDMPLGKLLRAIADATHTWFTSEKIAGDSEKSYRIQRRNKEETEIDTLLQARHEALMAAANWQWDAMVAYGKSEENPDLAGDPETKNLRPIARLIAALGPDAKNRLLNGDTLDFRGRDPACQEIVNGLYKGAWEEMKEGMEEDGKTAPPLTSEDAEAATFSIKLMDSGVSGETYIQLNFSPITYGRVETGWCGSLGIAHALRDKGLNLPPYPRDTQSPSPKNDMENQAMTLLRNNKERDWDHPLLRAKIDIEKPKDIKEPTFADAIQTVAAASGCNIVVEDFASHLDQPVYDDVFRKNTTVADSLSNMNFGGYADYIWFFNESDKLLVGWAGYVSGRGWRDHHRNLVAEEYISGLKRKLDGSGVEFDDAVHLSNLPQESFDEWIFYSRGFKCLDQARACRETALWQLYDSLETADKALAKSDGGLPLAKFDTAWIAGFFHAQKLAESAYICQPSSRTDAEEQKDEAERKLKERVMSDPDIISTMVMRVEKKPARGRPITFKTDDGRDAMTFGDFPAELKLSRYDMVIDYRIDGADRKMTIQGSSLAFPVRSEEREAEITRAAAAEKKGKQ